VWPLLTFGVSLNDDGCNACGIDDQNVSWSFPPAHSHVGLGFVSVLDVWPLLTFGVSLNDDGGDGFGIDDQLVSWSFPPAHSHVGLGFVSVLDVWRLVGCPVSWSTGLQRWKFQSRREKRGGRQGLSVVSFWKVPDINWFVLLYLSEPDCYFAYDDDPRDDVDVLSPSYVLGGYIWEYTDNDLGLNLYILYVYPYTIVSGAGNGFPQTIHFRKQICFHSMRTGTRLAVRVVCVCVCVFLRHTSKYRLALLRTVCVRARERLGKKEGKIHSWGWWCLTNGSWWCLMNGSFAVGSRIHNYTMFFWIGKWRKHRSVSTNNLLVPYTHTLSLNIYIHTYIHTYIWMWKRVPCWQGCLFLFSPQAPPCVRTALLESSQRHQVYLHCFGVLNLTLMGYCMRDVGDEFSHVLNWYKTSSQGCVCVCVCVFLRHTSKYRLALLRTVCVCARERLGKKEGKIHSWGWWYLTNGSWWCLMNGSFAVGSRIHNYTMFFWNDANTDLFPQTIYLSLTHTLSL